MVKKWKLKKKKKQRRPFLQNEGMPRTRKYASRYQSTPAEHNDNSPQPTLQNASHSQIHSELIATTNLSKSQPKSEPMVVANPSAQTTPSIEAQNPSTDENSSDRKKSNKYWTVDVIDEDRVTKERRLKVADVWMLPRGSKDICEKNTANKLKQTISHTHGSKTIVRKRKNYSRGEMYDITHKRKDRSFVNDEAKEKSDLLVMHATEGSSQTGSQDDAFCKDFEKEHLGHGRGMRFGVCPSQVFRSTAHHGMITSSSSSGSSNVELLELQSQLQSNNERIQVLENQVTEMTILMRNLVSHMPGSFPPFVVNQVADLGSPNEARHSSSASHEPQSHERSSPSP